MASQVAVVQTRERAWSMSETALLAWITGVTIVWMIGGHIDAWYHLHYGFEIESFLTAPHALLYAGWAALLAAPLVYLARRPSGQRGLWRALPPGVPLVLLGGVLFGLGGVFDAIWHSVFGFEVRQETLLTPAHQWLNLGFLVTMTGLVWAAVYARRAWPREQGAGPSWLPEVALVVGLANLFRALLWNLSFSEPTVTDFAAGGLIGSQLFGFASIVWRGETAQIAGTTGMLLHAVLLSAFLVSMVRYLRPPSGTIVVVLLWDGLLTALIGDMWRYLPAVVLAAAVGEIVWRQVKHGWLGGPADARGYWVLAWLVPATYVAGVMLVAATIGGGTIWTAHLVAGLPILSGLYGLAVGLLAVPPRWWAHAIS